MLVTLLGCSDASLTGFYKNTAPEITITSPGEGAVIGEAQPLVVVATMHDPETAVEDLRVSWLVDDAPVVDVAVVDGETATLTLAEGLPSGSHAVAVKALDTDGASADDAITLEVLANDPPTLTFFSPDDDGADEYAAGETIDVQAQVADDLDHADLSVVTLAWTLDRAAYPGPEHPATDGEVLFELPLDLAGGQHELTGVPTDSWGQAGSASGVAFVVGVTDADGDGFAAADDCDDADPNVSPAGVEDCDDGIDQDCDGSDAACSSGTIDLAGEVALTPTSGQLGGSSDACGDLDGWGDDDLVVGELSGGSGMWVFSGPILASETTAAARASGTGAFTVTCLGDFDGDGQEDLGWGTGSETARSMAYVTLGPVTGNIPADLELYGSGDASARVAAAGDVDGDGRDELLVGDGSGAWLVPGGSAPGGASLGTGDHRVFTWEGRGRVGGQLGGVGDVDGDGLDEVWIGASEGAFLLDDPTVSADGGDAVATFTGSATDGAVSLAAGGDLDGDGHLDLVIGDYFADDTATDAGASRVFLGPFAGGYDLTADASTSVVGARGGDLAGQGLALGDLDGDGLAELVVGAPFYDRAATDAGAAWLCRDLGPGTLLVEDCDVTMLGPGPDAHAGGTVAIGGDYDDDGLSDLVLGGLNVVYVVSGQGL